MTLTNLAILLCIIIFLVFLLNIPRLASWTFDNPKSIRKIENQFRIKKFIDGTYGVEQLDHNHFLGNYWYLPTARYSSLDEATTRKNKAINERKKYWAANTPVGGE